MRRRNALPRRRGPRDRVCVICQLPCLHGVLSRGQVPQEEARTHCELLQQRSEADRHAGDAVAQQHAQDGDEVLRGAGAVEGFQGYKFRVPEP